MMSKILYMEKSNIKNTNIDGFVDRLCFFTTIFLIFFAALVGIRNYIDPIECMLPPEYPSNWKDYIKEFCYISDTYTVASKINDKHTDVYTTKHGYYQWITLILVIQGLLIYLPHLAWKTFLHFQPIDIKHIVEKANVLRFLKGEEYNNYLKKFCGYLKNRLQYLQTTKIGNSVGFGWKITVSHILAKFFTATIIIFELHFINNNFGSVPDTFWGFTMLQENAASSIFPHKIVCDFNVLGGMYPSRSIECILPNNMMNEKIFILVWFWLALLLIFSIIDIVYTIYALFYSPRRYKTAKYFVQPDLNDNENNQKCGYSCSVIYSRTPKNINILDYNFEKEMFGSDGIYLLDCIKCNSGLLITTDIATKIDEPDAPSAI